MDFFLLLLSVYKFKKIYLNSNITAPHCLIKQFLKQKRKENLKFRDYKPVNILNNIIIILVNSILISYNILSNMHNIHN